MTLYLKSSQRALARVALRGGSFGCAASDTSICEAGLGELVSNDESLTVFSCAARYVD
jgi:hypothetical protein